MIFTSPLQLLGGRLAFLKRDDLMAADPRFFPIHGFRHVNIELLARRHAHVEAVALNGVEDLLRIKAKHVLRSGQRRVGEIGNALRAEDGRFGFLEARCCAAK